MKNLDFLFPLLTAAMGRRGRRHHRAARFFGRPHAGSFWNASTLLTALGLGVGAYEVFRSRGAGSGPTGGSGGPSFPSGPSNRTIVVDDPVPVGGTRPPPLPVIPSDARTSPADTLSDGGRRLVRLMLAAARADGELGEEEYGRLVREARKIGAEARVEAERANPRPLAEIVTGITAPALRREVYVLTYRVVRADEEISGTERIWLARLASLLGLDRATAERLEKDTDARIDAEPEEQG